MYWRFLEQLSISSVQWDCVGPELGLGNVAANCSGWLGVRGLFNCLKVRSLCFILTEAVLGHQQRI